VRVSRKNTQLTLTGVLTFMFSLGLEFGLNAQTNFPVSKLPGIDSIRNKSFVFVDTAGNQILFSALLEKRKVTAINFWATWCAPCRKEIPHLVGLFQEHDKDGLNIIGLTTEQYKSSVDKVKRAIKTQGIKYPVLFCSREAYYYLTGQNQSEPIYLPRLLVYNRSGEPTNKFVKWFGQKSIDEQTIAIENALKQR
jgi:thiol-disulfide isomerase/thioredoxin